MLFDLKDQEILGVKDISAQQKLNDYINLIKKWNKTRNLVSRQTSDQDLKEHVIDCLAINREIKTKKILDIGTGAGLPGIVIALTNPEKYGNLLNALSNKDHAPAAGLQLQRNLNMQAFQRNKTFLLRVIKLNT